MEYFSHLSNLDLLILLGLDIYSYYRLMLLFLFFFSVTVTLDVSKYFKTNLFKTFSCNNFFFFFL